MSKAARMVAWLAAAANVIVVFILAPAYGEAAYSTSYIKARVVVDQMSDLRPHSVWNIGAELGEGPVWVERDRALWFVDIKQQKIHRYDPAAGAKRSWDSPEQVGFIFPAADGGFVAGLQSGLYRFDQADGSLNIQYFSG